MWPFLGKLVLLCFAGLMTVYGLENDFALGVAAWGLAVTIAFWIGRPVGWLIGAMSLVWVWYVPGSLG